MLNDLTIQNQGVCMQVVVVDRRALCPEAGSGNPRAIHDLLSIANRLSSDGHMDKRSEVLIQAGSIAWRGGPLETSSSYIA